ncbi:vesicular-fusion protein S17 [Coemansia spiralis]|uniref:Vesicular-fusion protein S17 n=2 Tax=Coemansia TaxID=4863 RepID=A0A9W8G9W3_9FUNG|nr:vesicular-fusion protein sec17 [Coemansia spiralis]KAJ1987935.1 vesicular-fusion protein S17 [Coemansia umbellata]KAJ2622307.1 vesicular-fusion protein S17 [Coemansia sp. RSA 1358]KAJ2677894.1 vesicular-fusion protein S17 [Coemansia spiralis]
MSEQKAQELLQSADKKAQQKSWFSGPKYDEAGELYEQASSQFKLAKLMREAGEAMLKAAEMSLKLNDDNDAAQRYISASKSFKKTYPEQAVYSLKRAVELLTKYNRFYIAASHQKEIARIYEEELSDIENAMHAYQKAAEWYGQEDSTALANNCRLKVATIAAQLQDYARAVEIFESIAEGSVDNQLTKWSIKEYFLKAALCRLAIPDDVGAAEAVERYKDLDPGFSNTRECKFLDDIIADIKRGDIQAFTDHTALYDQISQLDNWKTSLLLSIKRHMSEAEEDLL